MGARRQEGVQTGGTIRQPGGCRVAAVQGQQSAGGPQRAPPTLRMAARTASARCSTCCWKGTPAGSKPGMMQEECRHAVGTCTTHQQSAASRDKSAAAPWPACICVTCMPATSQTQAAHAPAGADDSEARVKPSTTLSQMAGPSTREMPSTTCAAGAAAGAGSVAEWRPARAAPGCSCPHCCRPKAAAQRRCTAVLPAFQRRFRCRRRRKARNPCSQHTKAAPQQEYQARQQPKQAQQAQRAQWAQRGRTLRSSVSTL